MKDIQIQNGVEIHLLHHMDIIAHLANLTISEEEVDQDTYDQTILPDLNLIMSIEII